MTSNNAAADLIDQGDVTFGNVPKGRNALAVMGLDGDTKITWDPRIAAEVESAKRQFDYLTGEKRYAAFRMEPDGERGEMIKEFDPEAERIVLAPQMQGG